MRYLKTYSELHEPNMETNESKVKGIKLDYDFINALKKELENIGFDLNYDDDDAYVDIKKDVTYIDFFLDEFSIKKLKKLCNDNLDDDKSSWTCDNVVRDEFDLLCTTILVFIDEYAEKVNESITPVGRLEVRKYLEDILLELDALDLPP